MLLTDYISWHYSVALSGILGLLRNYLIGTWHRFMIGQHFKTLFSPWHRSRVSNIGATLTFGDRISNAVVDFYIRILAAVIRLSIILTGLVTEAILIVAFAALFIIWLLWPAIFIFSLIKGLASFL